MPQQVIDKYILLIRLGLRTRANMPTFALTEPQIVAALEVQEAA